MASCQSAKIDFRSQLFYAKNQPNVSQFCLVKNTNLGAHFLDHFITKMMPYLWQLAINPKLKIQ